MLSHYDVDVIPARVETELDSEDVRMTKSWPTQEWAPEQRLTLVESLHRAEGPCNRLGASHEKHGFGSNTVLSFDRSTARSSHLIALLTTEQ